MLCWSVVVFVLVGVDVVEFTSAQEPWPEQGTVCGQIGGGHASFPASAGVVLVMIG